MKIFKKIGKLARLKTNDFLYPKLYSAIGSKKNNKNKLLFVMISGGVL